MTVQTFPVAPGQVTPLTGSMPAGAVVINTDANNAVWIGDTPSAAPGNGVRLGPRGSMTWTTAGAPAYAAPDTGNTAAVLVTVATDISAVDNPVDIGVSVATQLLQNGVPNVLVGDVLLSGAALLPYNMDVSRYASLQLTFYVSSPGALNISFVAHGVPVSTSILNIDIASGFVSITMPVEGPLLSITFNASGAYSLVTMWGSNRSTGALRLTGTTPSFSAGLGTMPFTNGQTVKLPPVLTTNGGPHWFRANISGTGKGYFAYTDYTQNVSAQTMYFIDSNNSHAAASGSGVDINQLIVLPPGMYRLIWLSQIAATYNLGLNIIPSGL